MMSRNLSVASSPSSRDLRRPRHRLQAKRALDIAAASFGLISSAPIMLPAMFLVWRQDRSSPFYISQRVGQGGGNFRMIKLRSMVVGADSTGVDSTSEVDVRITGVGHFIRRYKLDEVAQLVNVLRGDMSLVGPRPNVRRETDLYTDIERNLLSVKPGITDFASIVFADEGKILEGREDPDIAYNELIRPGKSKLGLFYIEHRTIGVDLRICWLTGLGIVSRGRALTGVSKLLASLGASSELVELATRRNKLEPCPPPGANQIVRSRKPVSGEAKIAS